MAEALVTRTANTTLTEELGDLAGQTLEDR